MTNIYVTNESNYPISTTNIKKRLGDFLTNRGVAANREVGVSVVGKKIMIDLAKKYLKEEEVLHNVLTFSESEITGKFMYPSGQRESLGEIIVCYPKIFEEAKGENKQVDDKLYELIEHGARHLLGEHHE